MHVCKRLPVEDKGMVWRTEASIRSPRPGAVGSGEPLDKCWGLNSSALQKQQVFLMPEPSLQTIAEL